MRIQEMGRRESNLRLYVCTESQRRENRRMFHSGSYLQQNCCNRADASSAGGHYITLIVVTLIVDKFRWCIAQGHSGNFAGL